MASWIGAALALGRNSPLALRLGMFISPTILAPVALVSQPKCVARSGNARQEVLISYWGGGGTGKVSDEFGNISRGMRTPLAGKGGTLSISFPSESKRVA